MQRAAAAGSENSALEREESGPGRDWSQAEDSNILGEITDLEFENH